MYIASTVSRPTIRTLLLSAAVLGFLGLNSIAMADTQLLGSRSKPVVLNDLDLTTQVGQRVALERVHQMARVLCGQLSDHLDLGHQPHFVACVERTMTEATSNLQAMVNRKSQTMLAQAK